MLAHSLIHGDDNQSRSKSCFHITEWLNITALHVAKYITKNFGKARSSEGGMYEISRCLLFFSDMQIVTTDLKFIGNILQRNGGELYISSPTTAIVHGNFINYSAKIAMRKHNLHGDRTKALTSGITVKKETELIGEGYLIVRFRSNRAVDNIFLGGGGGGRGLRRFFALPHPLLFSHNYLETLVSAVSVFLVRLA